LTTGNRIPPGTWIDAHAHLDRLSGAGLAETLAEASAAGVTTVLSCATGLSSSASVIRQCRDFPSLYGAVGISPFESHSLPDGWEDLLLSYLDRENIVALGEIGLDGSNADYPALDIQLPVFDRQLRMASERCLPVVVHSRGAELMAAEMCRSAGVAKAVFHCFTGKNDALMFILESGYHVSFSGIVTFSDDVARLAERVPLDRILIETDTPYLAPVPCRGKANRPAWVAFVGEAVACCKGIPADKLQDALRRNFEWLFL
jgi:TatD DNase family protein